jgi:hypothetical protein
MGQGQSRGRGNGDHFYTLDFKGELAPRSGYIREDFDCFVYQTRQPGTVPVHRWFKSRDGITDHFYTTDPEGEAAPANSYVYEGIAFFIFSSQEPDTVPLNRWFHPQIGDHFYTTHPTGELAPLVGYVPEGIAGFVFKSQLRGSIQLWRWFHAALLTLTFDEAITDEQQDRVWERQGWAYYRAGKCTHLTQQQKDEVRGIYERDTIHHGIDNRPGVNASAMVGGRFININFNVLFPQGDTEIAMTLLHEMMHCTGYSHPDKGTVPDDVYFNTVPLNAEKCIAGFASDVASPVLALARGELMADGKLKEEPTPLAADEASTKSGCGVYPAGRCDPKTGERLQAVADLVGTSADVVDAAKRDWSQPEVKFDPYSQGDMSRAVGLHAIIGKLGA